MFLAGKKHFNRITRITHPSKTGPNDRLRRTIGFNDFSLFVFLRVISFLALFTVVSLYNWPHFACAYFATKLNVISSLILAQF